MGLRYFDRLAPPQNYKIIPHKKMKTSDGKKSPGLIGEEGKKLSWLKGATYMIKDVSDTLSTRSSHTKR